MTYMPGSDFSTSVDSTPSESRPSTVEKLKTLTTEGMARSQRVAEILRSAFSQTVAEVKDGRAVLSPLAKEVTAETVATVKDKSQQAADVFSHTWEQESDKKDLTARMIAFMQSLADTLKVALLPQLKGQAVKLDGVLSDRYGQRYDTIKDQFEFVRSWYVVPETTTVESPEETVSDTVAIEVESKVVR